MCVHFCPVGLSMCVCMLQHQTHRSLMHAGTEMILGSVRTQKVRVQGLRLTVERKMLEVVLLGLVNMIIKSNKWIYIYTTDAF